MSAVANRLEDWAKREPERVAVIEGERQLSYAELNKLGDQLAHALLARGISSDDIVAVRSKNIWQWPVINAALAKVGCQMLGLNWRLTPSEMQYIFSNSGATAFICDDLEPWAMAQAVSDAGIGVWISINTQPNPEDAFEHWDSLFFQEGFKPLYSQVDASLIIYTSGTTGFPKGVAAIKAAPGGADAPKNIEIREYQASMRGDAPTEAETVLVTMPMHHAAGPSIVRTAIARGSTMVMLPRFDAETVLQLIERYKVSSWNGVPTMYKRIAALPEAVLQQYDVSSINSLSVGAAPVPGSLRQWIVDHFGPCVRESYGSTEVSMVSALLPEMMDKKPGSSGKPFRHVKVSVRDERGRELPTGEVGELWIYTPVAIHNYLGCENLAEDTVDKNGFFRMGDVGYLDEDGYLYITDRVKDMIISGGVNIYPAEIEAVLIQHEAVQDVAVIGIPDEEFGEQVKAFCELVPGKDISVEELNLFAVDRLASYKRPRSLDIVSELPRNTMGKILKRTLREPYWQNQERKV